MRAWKFAIAGVSTVIVAGSLASCAWIWPDKPPPIKDCTRAGAACEVEVVVNDCKPVTNETILVDKSGPPVEIHWKAPAGYLFTREGIKFDPSPVIEQKPGSQAEGGRWVVVDRPNGQKVVSKYRIQVRSVSTPGTVCTGPDPVIINDRPPA